ncbi:MAG: hypothetical protein KBD07_04665, partial [Candidatus Omnitrophica bacterium]|nr:hypothetical protein [Candidatus Omnitrophota bacterium]
WEIEQLRSSESQAIFWVGEITGQRGAAMELLSNLPDDQPALIRLAESNAAQLAQKLFPGSEIAANQSRVRAGQLLLSAAEAKQPYIINFGLPDLGLRDIGSLVMDGVLQAFGVKTSRALSRENKIITAEQQLNIYRAELARSQGTYQERQLWLQAAIIGSKAAKTVMEDNLLDTQNEIDEVVAPLTQEGVVSIFDYMNLAGERDLWSARIAQEAANRAQLEAELARLGAPASSKAAGPAPRLDSFSDVVQVWMQRNPGYSARVENDRRNQDRPIRAIDIGGTGGGGVGFGSDGMSIGASLGVSIRSLDSVEKLSPALTKFMSDNDLDFYTMANLNDLANIWREYIAWVSIYQATSDMVSTGEDTHVTRQWEAALPRIRAEAERARLRLLAQVNGDRFDPLSPLPFDSVLRGEANTDVLAKLGVAAEAVNFEATDEFLADINGAMSSGVNTEIDQLEQAVNKGGFLSRFFHSLNLVGRTGSWAGSSGFSPTLTLNLWDEKHKPSKDAAETLIGGAADRAQSRKNFTLYLLKSAQEHLTHARQSLPTLSARVGTAAQLQASENYTAGTAEQGAAEATLNAFTDYRMALIRMAIASQAAVEMAEKVGAIPASPRTGTQAAAQDTPGVAGIVEEAQRTEEELRILREQQRDLAAKEAALGYVDKPATWSREDYEQALEDRERWVQSSLNRIQVGNSLNIAPTGGVFAESEEPLVSTAERVIPYYAVHVVPETRAGPDGTLTTTFSVKSVYPTSEALDQAVAAKAFPDTLKGDLDKEDQSYRVKPPRVKLPDGSYVLKMMPAAMIDPETQRIVDDVPSPAATDFVVEMIPTAEEFRSLNDPAAVRDPDIIGTAANFDQAGSPDRTKIYKIVRGGVADRAYERVLDLKDWNLYIESLEDPDTDALTPASLGKSGLPAVDAPK